METSEQTQRDHFKNEFKTILESENLPSIPNTLEILHLEELPDLTEWRL